MQWDIQKADAYGGILLTQDGRVLLREPSNHFDGYVWTFAKGKARASDSPEDTALREVEEECGYIAEIVDVLPGVYKSGLSSNAYFVMRHHGSQKAFDWETWGTRWVNFDEAERLINETTNIKGRQRDLAVLEAAKQWFLNNRTVVLPEADRDSLLAARPDSWENCHPLPEKNVKLDLDFFFNKKQSNSIRLGFIPKEMEDKWFSYFKDNVLYQHRSWTGICIYEIYFKSTPEGLHAVYAKINRDPDQYGITDIREDADLIKELLMSLANHGMVDHSPSGFLSDLATAVEPNYLGNPEVMAELLNPFFQCIIDLWSKKATYKDEMALNCRISSVISGQDEDYTCIPDWHNESALGSALIACFDLDEDYCSGENLYFITTEALASISLCLKQAKNPVMNSVKSPQFYNVSEQLQRCWSYIISVFMGTHSVLFPGVVFSDMVSELIDMAEDIAHMD